MSSSDLDPGGQTGGDSASLGDYIDADADSLWGKVDFLRLVADTARTTIVGVIVGVAGVILAIADAFGDLLGMFSAGLFAIPEAVLSAPAEMQRIATEQASRELNAFGVLALPVGTAFALLTLFGITAVLYVFFGEDFL